MVLSTPSMEMMTPRGGSDDHRQLPAGWRSTRWHCRVLLRSPAPACAVVLAVAGVGSAFAPDPVWLIVLRAVAGVGAAAVFPVTLSALIDAYPAHRRGFAVAVWSAVSAGGTLVAGLLLEAFWWGSVQLAFGIAALVLIPGVARCVAQRRNRTLSLDPIGALLSLLALTGIVYAVIQAPEHGWTAPTTLLPLSVGLAALALLVLPVGIGVGTALAAPALTRVGPRWTGAGGLAAMAAGFAILAAAASDEAWHQASGLVVFGFGLAVTPGTVLILDGLPAERRSVASALNDITREVGGVFGIAVLSTVLLTGYRRDIAGALVELPDALAGPAQDGAGAALGVAGGLGADGAALAVSRHRRTRPTICHNSTNTRTSAPLTWTLSPPRRMDLDDGIHIRSHCSRRVRRPGARPIRRSARGVSARLPGRRLHLR